MNELKMPGMKSEAIDSPFRGFFRMVLSVTDDRMANGGKLHPDLILQSRYQFDSDERSTAQRTFHGIAEFGTGRLRIALSGQLLKHSLLPKVVNERPFFGVEVPANDCEILPHRCMAQKLSDQGIAVRSRLGKEQYPGRVTIDAVHHKGPLSSHSQFSGENGKSGRSSKVLGRHRQQFGRFIESHDGIVFVKDDKPTRGARLTPIPFPQTITTLAWRFLH